jgi:glycerol-3-phosphate dehydrogenase
MASPSPDPRRAALARLADESFDLVVVGGGIVGAGVLLDAASRGLRAALIEQGDVAGGTSSRSSRLIHGGLRYLEQFGFQLVHEALAERHRLLRLAPHLVRLEPLLFPIYGLPAVHRAFYGAGMLLYDLLGARQDGGWAGHLTVEQTLEWAPPLRRDRLQGGIVYHDAVEDDARYALAVVRTAVDLGAAAVTRLRATGLSERNGRLAGVRALDLEDGGEVDVRAGHIVDATGAWAADPGHPFGRGRRVLPSRGSHLVIPRARIPVAGGMTLRIPGRVAFLVPWPDHWIVGTTDAPWHGSLEHPTTDAAEVDVLLDTLNRGLDLRLTPDDVVGTFAGLRPLAVGDGADEPNTTRRVSREHRIDRRPDGLVRVSGGKYTTYRLMARQVVDTVLGPQAAANRPSRTANQPIHGALPIDDLKALADRLASDALDARAARALVARHGSEAEAVVELGRSGGWLGRLSDDADHLEAEVVHAVRSELARSVDDVLARRVRLAMQLRDRGASIVSRVADLMGDELGWDEARRALEASTYLASAEREYGVPA